MRLLLLLSSCSCLLAQPLFLAENAASEYYRFSNVYVYGIAPGSLINVGWLGDSRTQAPALDPATASVQLIPDSPPQTITLTVLGAASSSTVLALIPSNAPLGPATLQLTVNGIPLASTSVNIVSSALALFANGPLATSQSVLADGTYVANSLTAPAHPGDFVTLWGTGLGNVSTKDVTATVGGVAATVTYAGHSSTPGLDQINVQIPTDPIMPLGCYVALEATVPLSFVGITETTNRTSISLAASGASACAHPLGLTAEEMQTLDQGGTIPLLQLGVSSSMGSLYPNFVDYSRSETATATIQQLDAVSVAGASGGMLQAPSALFGCAKSPVIANPAQPFAGGLTAGASITLSGPSDQTLTLPTVSTNPYYYAKSFPPSSPAPSPDAAAASFFTPGAWTLSAPGGANIAPFSVPLTVAPTIRLTNTAALGQIVTGQDLLVTWDTTGLTQNEMVSVSSLLTGPCTAPALQGSLTIPSSFLLANGPATLPILPGPWIQAKLTPMPGVQSSFRVPLAGGGSVPGVFSQSSSEDATAVIEPSAPAIFAGNIANQNGSANSVSNPAAPGSTIVVWGTGLSGNITVTAMMGGDPVNASYSGADANLPGVFQVNLPVPAGLPSGPTKLSLCRTPVGGGQICGSPVTLYVK